MSRTQSTHYDLMRDHGRSEIVSQHVQAATEKVRSGEIAGFPWQFVMVIAVIALGVLVVVLKGAGVF